MKKLCLLFLMCGLGRSVSLAQAVVTYYPFNSVVSLNTEIAPMLRLSQTRNAVYYAGVGINTSIVGKLLDQEDLLKGYFLSAGVRVRPFEKLQNVGIAFEASPYSAKNFKSGIFRTWLGVSYYFGGGKK